MRYPFYLIRETGGALNDYYSSLQAQLTTYFDQNVSVYHIQPDSSCLYSSLSHTIFGTENCFAILKYNLINTFITSTQHHYNVMHRSGILSEQESHEHNNHISAPNAWCTNVELNMLAALASVVNSMNWNILPKYIHSQLDILIECDPIFNAQRVCILHHRLSRLEGNEHFDSSFFCLVMFHRSDEYYVGCFMFWL